MLYALVVVVEYCKIAAAHFSFSFSLNKECRATVYDGVRLDRNLESFRRRRFDFFPWRNSRPAIVDSRAVFWPVRLGNTYVSRIIVAC